uniref:Reverse transcriptase zinc-binding domain-containing protein n=1 Tax=Setaria italica TaxID=4555 RepID=K4A2V3_SETIT
MDAAGTTTTLRASSGTSMCAIESHRPTGGGSKQNPFRFEYRQRAVRVENRLTKSCSRNWPCSPTCVLCDQAPETALHLCLLCPFAKEVWFLVANWTGTAAIQQGADEEDLEQWWNKALEQCNDRRRRSIAAILMYIAWHIWKERKRRVFDNKIRRPDQVLGLIQEDICLHRQACGKPLIEAELNLS